MGFSHLLIMLMAISSTQQANWEFQFEKEGVKVYTKTIEGSGFKSFRGEMTFEVNAEEIVAQIFDIASYPQWCYKTTSTKIMKQEKNKVFYHYVSETPPLVKNREAYFYTEILPDSPNGEITIKLGTYPCDQPLPEGFVRIPFSEGFWKLVPLSENKTFVQFQMQAEPGGIIPSWLANMAAEDSPWITMTGLQKVILEKKR